MFLYFKLTNCEVIKIFLVFCVCDMIYIERGRELLMRHETMNRYNDDHDDDEYDAILLLYIKIRGILLCV